MNRFMRCGHCEEEQEIDAFPRFFEALPHGQCDPALLKSFFQETRPSRIASCRRATHPL